MVDQSPVACQLLVAGLQQTVVDQMKSKMVQPSSEDHLLATVLELTAVVQMKLKVVQSPSACQLLVAGLQQIQIQILFNK